MKETSREIAHPAFPYCTKHNRLFPHASIGWLTPARPHELETFQALCDECRRETVCNSVLLLRTITVPDVMSA